MSALSDEFAEAADELLDEFGETGTLVVVTGESYSTTTLANTQTTSNSTVTVAPAKATASRLSGFGIEMSAERVARLQFYYLRGAVPEVGCELTVGGQEMTIVAISEMVVNGVTVLYQVLCER